MGSRELERRKNSGGDNNQMQPTAVSSHRGEQPGSREATTKSSVRNQTDSSDW